MDPPCTSHSPSWGKAATGTRGLRSNLPDFTQTAILARGLAETSQLVRAKWSGESRAMASLWHKHPGQLCSQGTNPTSVSVSPARRVGWTLRGPRYTASPGEHSIVLPRALGSLIPQSPSPHCPICLQTTSSDNPSGSKGWVRREGWQFSFGSLSFCSVWSLRVGRGAPSPRRASPLERYRGNNHRSLLPIAVTEEAVWGSQSLRAGAPGDRGR